MSLAMKRLSLTVVLSLLLGGLISADDDKKAQVAKRQERAENWIHFFLRRDIDFKE